MLIGYDGRFITKQLTGNGVYATRLIEALSNIDHANCYRLYIPGSHSVIPAKLQKNVQIREMHPLHLSAWLRVTLFFPWEIRRFPVDIFHAHYTIPWWINTKVVLTLHDFFWLVYPKQFVSIKRIPITFTIKKSAARADRILVGTNFIKQQTIEYLGVPENRLTVIPYGLSPRFLKRVDKSQIAKICRKYGIDAPYILAVGDIHPRKNLNRLLKAFELLPEKKNIKLVLVGKPLWKVNELYEHIMHHGLENRIIFTGYVPDQDLPIIYQGAAVFCYPSLYEGFGFPILEAMASGVPVATSNTTSCPEVGGETAMYFDPTSIEDIAEKLNIVLADSEFRTKIIKAGIEWASSFSWENTARKTLEIYMSLV